VSSTKRLPSKVLNDADDDYIYTSTVSPTDDNVPVYSGYQNSRLSTDHHFTVHQNSEAQGPSCGYQPVKTIDMAQILQELQIVQASFRLLRQTPDLNVHDCVKYLEAISECCVIWWDMTENQFKMLSTIYSQYEGHA
jgi:hypothetical protein